MDKKLAFLSTIFFILFTLFISIIILNQPLKTFTRAKEELIPSSKNSLILVWPLNAPADGKTQININVFVRNAKNLSLPNKKVSLTTTLGKINEIQPITDKNGKSVFTLTSTSPGVAEIEALIDNQIKLDQKLTVKFE